MPKGQFTILQYVLFFTIGIGLFFTLSNVFLSQYTSLGQDFASSNSMITNSLVSADTIYLSDQCKQCGQVYQNLTIQNATKILQLIISSNGITISNPLLAISYFSTIHNMNYTLNFSTNIVSLSKTINISINKDKNNLDIGNTE